MCQGQRADASAEMCGYCDDGDDRPRRKFLLDFESGYTRSKKLGFRARHAGEAGITHSLAKE